MDFAERNRTIVEQVKAGKTLRAIADDVGLTFQRIQQIAADHGVYSQHQFAKPVAWDIARADALRMNGRPFTEIAERLEARNGGSVRSALARRGLYMPQPAPERWRADEIALLRELWGTHFAREIAQRLGRSKNEIIGKAKRLGLPRLDPHRRRSAQVTNEARMASRNAQARRQDLAGEGTTHHGARA